MSRKHRGQNPLGETDTSKRTLQLSSAFFLKTIGDRSAAGRNDLTHKKDKKKAMEIGDGTITASEGHAHCKPIRSTSGSTPDKTNREQTQNMGEKEEEERKITKMEQQTHSPHQGR